MRLKRPLIGSLTAIFILLMVISFNVQAMGVDLAQILETPFSIFLPLVKKSTPVPTVTVSPPGGGISHQSQLDRFV